MNYLKTKDMMNMFGVTTQTIQNWRNSGLPHKKISHKTIVYDENEVKEWLNERHIKK